MKRNKAVPGKTTPLVSIGMPVFNSGKYLRETLEALAAQTAGDFEVLMFDDASTDRTGEICRDFSGRDSRFRYFSNPENKGAIRNHRQVFEMSSGKYFMWAADHDLWKQDMLEKYLRIFSEEKNAVLVYAPAAIIDAHGEVQKPAVSDIRTGQDRFATFLDIINGRITSDAICGLLSAEAVKRVSLYGAVGVDTIFLSELSLKGAFVQLPETLYFRRQNRKVETPAEKIARYNRTLFDNLPEFIRARPVEYMVYCYFCMVQNNGLNSADQGILNGYILDTFTKLWGVKDEALLQMIIDMKQHGATAQNRQTTGATERVFKDALDMLDLPRFVNSLEGTSRAVFSEELKQLISRGKLWKSSYMSAKKFPTGNHYDVCYLLYDTAKWGGVKGTIAQANGLVERGYSVCIVSRSGRPDWTEITGDFIRSPLLSPGHIPVSDIVVGTLYPTVAVGFAAKKGVCVHYCRGYEGQVPGLTKTQADQIREIYRFPTVKIANSPNVARILKEEFGQDSFVVRNDIDHSFFAPRKGEPFNGCRVLIVGPYEVAWKGIGDCLKAAELLKKDLGKDLEIIRVSQTGITPEERAVTRALGDAFKYYHDLSEREMADLYNSCTVLISGSYPAVESFGRPAMEALACGLPSVLTDIPAYRDFDPNHDYALFVQPGDSRAMAAAAKRIIKDEVLRSRLVDRGIEVSSAYDIRHTLDDLETVLQDIYKGQGHEPSVSKTAAYYEYTRPEVQQLVSSNSRRILDVGCASGGLGAELKKRLKAEVWGVEVVQEIAHVARQRLDKVIIKEIGDAIPLLPEDYFDTIILADVLEHLTDPLSVLRRLKEKLVVNGEIVASIPNVRHWSVLKALLEGRWDYQDAGILDRTHLRFFTRQTIIELFRDADIEIKELRATVLKGCAVPEDVVKALSGTSLDISSLGDEGNHYQYLVRAQSRPATEEPVSIVILTFNQLDVTRECVASIQKHTPEPHEIIFVDNGSTDGTVKWLRKLSHENRKYRLIENRENLGFAKGCNQGIMASAGGYILLLNNDVVVTRDWLSGMLECLKRSTNTGIVGPMTNNISGIQKVEKTGYRKLRDLDSYAASFREQYRNRRIYARRIVGFCMLFRRSLVEKIGLLDETFGTGNFEDDDYCLRSEMEGYSNVIAADVFIHHYGSRSFTGNKIDYSGTMKGNKRIYNEKWGAIDVRTEAGKKAITLKALDKAGESFHRGDMKKAVDLLLEGIRFAPSEKRLYFALAVMLMDVRRFKDGLDALNEMPEGDEPMGLVLKGQCLEGLEQFDGAHAEAEKALSIDSGYSPAINLMGALAYRKGDRETAQKLFREAIGLDPGFGEAYTNLGVALWAEKKHDDGFAFLERGFICSPDRQDIVDAYYSAVTQTGSFARAEDLLRQVCALFPLSRRLSFLLIDALIKQERHDAALAETEEAMLKFGVDDEILAAALSLRKRVGHKEISASRRGQSLSVCMIVKDEENCLARCLRSIAPIADEIIVADTGSADRTKDIAEVYGAKVFDFAWNHDFSDARNFSLSRSSGDWIFVMDADEALSDLDYDRLLGLLKKDKSSAYSFTTRNYVDRTNVEGWKENDGRYQREEAGMGWIPSLKVRLFPNDASIRFENPVHELVERSLREKDIRILPCDIPIHHYGKLVAEELHREKAEEYYRIGRKKLQESGEDFFAIRELAIQAAEVDRYEEAIELWERALKIRPDYSSAYFNMSYCYLQLNRFREGSRAAQRALEFNPGLKESVLNFATCELRGGDPESAVNSLEDMVSKHPAHAAAIGLLGVIYIVTDREEQGRECFGKLSKMNADCPELLLRHSRMLFDAGRKDYAVKVLHAAEDYGYLNDEILGLLDAPSQEIRQNIS